LKKKKRGGGPRWIRIGEKGKRGGITFCHISKKPELSCQKGKKKHQFGTFATEMGTEEKERMKSLHRLRGQK